MLGRSAVAYIPVNLTSVIYSFGGLAVLTRLLEPAEYGRYAIAIVTMLAVHMGLFTWLEAAMARYQARAEADDDVNSHLKTIYSYALITALVGWTASMALMTVLPMETALKSVIMFAITSTCFQLFLNLGNEAHKAAHRIMRYSANYSAHLMLSFVIGIVLIMTTTLREIGPIAGIMTASILVLLIDIPFMRKPPLASIRQAIISQTGPLIFCLFGWVWRRRRWPSLHLKKKGWKAPKKLCEITGRFYYSWPCPPPQAWRWWPLMLGLSLAKVSVMDGLMGAVYATVAAYALGLIIAMIVGRRYYPLPVPVRAFFEVSFACIVMAMAVMALPIPDSYLDVFSLLIKAAVGGIVYVIVTFAINAAGCRKVMMNTVQSLRDRREPKLAEVTK